MIWICQIRHSKCPILKLKIGNDSDQSHNSEMQQWVRRISCLIRPKFTGFNAFFDDFLLCHCFSSINIRLLYIQIMKKWIDQREIAMKTDKSSSNFPVIIGLEGGYWSWRLRLEWVIIEWSNWRSESTKNWHELVEKPHQKLPFTSSDWTLRFEFHWTFLKQFSP